MDRRKDTSITVRLPLAMKEAVARVADSERRTLSQMVAVVLESFLVSRHEWPQRATATKRATTTKRTRSAARGR
jgi:predicted transcriptional regulator